VSEPAVARAVMCNYDPHLQVQSRLTALKNIGHPTDKINVRIIGGTWSYYPRQYQNWFIKEIYRACNQFNLKIKEPKNLRILAQLQRKNEKAKCRVVEISVETRQDYIDKKEIRRLRNFGVTKVEIGAQSLDDEILKRNRRGHDVAATIKATKLLKDAGFKVAYQMMANLPGSNLAKDKKIFKELFENSNFRPDYLKIYPLALVKNSGVYNLYLRKKFKPYSKQQLLNLIKYIKSIVPHYLRIERIIRDIPTADIVEGGAKISNMRQILQSQMKTEGLRCRCIRCREIKDKDYTKFKPYLNIREYKASKGKEFFLSFETRRRDKIFSMLRLRIPSDTFLAELKDAAIIREIHTYGQQLSLSRTDKAASQHKGLGKKLIKKAERIAKKNGYQKIAVISGVGVRPYFKKLGYKLQNTYMIKNL
jgi:elongator complex protein 3